MLNRHGDNIQPCRTPRFIIISSDVSCSYHTGPLWLSAGGKDYWLSLFLWLVLRLSIGFRKARYLYRQIRYETGIRNTPFCCHRYFRFRCRAKKFPAAKIFPPPWLYRLYYPLCVSRRIDTWQIVYLPNKDPCPKISICKSEIKVH